MDLREKSTDEILLQLQGGLTFPDSIQTPYIREYELRGEFKLKIKDILKKAKIVNTFHKFDEILWRRCEVGHYTGNQLLRGLVAFCRDKELFTPGSGVVMTINEEPHLAMHFSLDERVIFGCPSPANQEKKRYFDKIFDESWCELQKDNPYHQKYCTDDKLWDIRGAVPHILPEFLNYQIVETTAEYRHAFTGLLQELIIFEMRGKNNHQVVNRIPFAACVWLAVNHGLSHKLQAVFGDKYFSYSGWRKRLKQENPDISIAELDDRIAEVKALEQLEGARFIVRR